MSRYTTEVRAICEQVLGHTELHDGASVNQIITDVAPRIFNFDFPIFDEAYRLPLERKILKHYYTREIGLETVGLWKLKLDTKLNEIMPYYNKLYESELLTFNPFYDVELTRSHNRTAKGQEKTIADSETHTTSSTDTTSHTDTSSTLDGKVQTDSTGTGTTELTDATSNNQTVKESDTPQGAIEGLETDTYLTRASITDGTANLTRTQTDRTEGTNDQVTTSTADDITNGTIGVEQTSTVQGDNVSNTTTENLEDYIEKVSGKQGTASYAGLLTEFRNTFLNLDMRVIEELEELFMQVW